MALPIARIGKALGSGYKALSRGEKGLAGVKNARDSIEEVKARLNQGQDIIDSVKKVKRNYAPDLANLSARLDIKNAARNRKGLNELIGGKIMDKLGEHPGFSKAREDWNRLTGQDLTENEVIGLSQVDPGRPAFPWIMMSLAFIKDTIEAFANLSIPGVGGAAIKAFTAFWHLAFWLWTFNVFGKINPARKIKSFVREGAVNRVLSKKAMRKLLNATLRRVAVWLIIMMLGDVLPTTLNDFVPFSMTMVFLVWFSRTRAAKMLITVTEAWTNLQGDITAIEEHVASPRRVRPSEARIHESQQGLRAREKRRNERIDGGVGSIDDLPRAA